MLFLFMQIVSNKSEQRDSVPDTYYTNSDYTNVVRFMKIKSNSTQDRQKTQKAQKGKKLVFLKNM